MEIKTELNTEEMEKVSGGAGSTTQALIINCEHRVNARKGPSTDYEVIAHAYAGRTYRCYGWNGNWALLSIDGKKAYVYKEFIAIVK